MVSHTTVQHLPLETGILQKSVRYRKKNGLVYLLDDNRKVRKYKSWLNDSLAFLYDWIMCHSVFPKKFNGSVQMHYEILRDEFKNIYGNSILEIATGSGDAVKFLNSNNLYSGTDISPELLRIAVKKFRRNKFKNAEFYIADACDLSFKNNLFDFILCNLSINFFSCLEDFITELKRVLKTKGTFFCSVPVPEKKKTDTKIRGKLYSEKELKQLFAKHGFKFEKLHYDNGALLYFKVRIIPEN